MLIRVLLFFSLFLLFGCSDDSNPTKPTHEDLKAEANDFSMSIVQSILDSDSTSFKTFLPDSIYFLEPWEEPILASELNVSDVFSSLDFSNYSLDDYKDTYSYRVMDFDEYSVVEEGWLETFIYWKPDSEDYFFWGNNVKEGKQKFPHSDIFAFMVTKRSGTWKIRAFGG